MRPSIERFWEKVETGLDCWIWTAAVNKDGYGKFWFGGVMRAHRFAWEDLIGPIPPGKHVLHKCDNRRCVNTEHLFIGTNSDNAKDAFHKGRRDLSNLILFQKGNIPWNKGIKQQ
jgi:hypothetical protein